MKVFKHFLTNTFITAYNYNYNYFGSNLPKIFVESSILERLKFELDETVSTVL